MVDYQVVATEMKAAEQRIRNSFLELGTLDYRRAEHFYDYFKHSRPEDLERFRKDTIASKNLLHDIKKDFRKIVNSMSLIEKDAYKHHNFKVVLKRSRYMESLLHDFFKHRKTQIHASRSLLRQKNIQNPYLKKGYEFYKKGLCTLQEKRLILSFGKERDLAAIFEGFSKDEKERIDAAFQAYSNEKRNIPMTDAPLTTIVLVPTLRAALGLAVHAGYQWSNHYGYNHKLLVKSSAERDNGPAI